ncbi:MAG TPA: class I SAM-dependent methyltransferase, partial [Rhodocyclaceae bacterium]|nr:class I SAM-dependent methyltransferase [Rhodocyclaceae bacterium]
MQAVTHRNDCRLCNSTRLDLVLPIRPSPIGDEFVPADRLDQPQDLYPLDTYLCLDCGHLQNLDIVNPDILFRNYTYRSSVTLGLVDHFKAYAETVVSRFSIEPGALVVEIGSNDGSLLKAYKAHGLRVIGVDPAVSIAKRASEDGIPTQADFFSYKVAEDIRAQQGPAAVMCANNVFAHVDNITDIVKGIRMLLAPDGIFVFEVSYVPDIIDNFVFDTIYHEHVSHHALLPLEKFFNRHDMSLFDVERVKSKGGSIRGYAQCKSSGQRLVSERLTGMMTEERARGIELPEIYRRFYRDIEERKRATLAHVDAALAQGKHVAAFGASTTTTTLLYHFELQSRIEFIADDNPIKQGCYSPGAHIPVLPSSELL